MTTKVSEPQVIELLPGCQPGTDKTAFSTQHSTISDKVRWFQGVPQKIGGWAHITFDFGAAINGVCRRIFSAFLASQSTLVTAIGTHTTLYALTGTNLTNITPLQTATTTIANAMATDFRTLAANPLTFTLGSGTIQVADANAANYLPGDDVTLSGLSGTIRGINSAVINGQQVVRTVGAGFYTIIVNGTATSNGTGGGVSVGLASGLVTVTAAAHGMLTGQRTKLLAATAFGGITIGQINIEFIIRNALTNTFQVMTTGTATSAVTGAGGASTTFQAQLAAGNKDESVAAGYGAGLYGVGLYGTGLISANGRTFPRIWYIDRFQADMIMTPGNSAGVYSWDGNTAVAPALLANAPTDINYVFVSNDIVVTFGHQGVANQIFASDIQNPTIWSASSTNQVFQDTVSGAGPLISHLSVNGTNLIFSNNRTYVFTYIGLPLVWDIALLDGSIGLIAPLARCVVNGVAYWMGQKNFYRWRGGNVEVVPANSQLVSTILNYVYNNLSSSQRSKIFCWFNERFGEIWFHYPSAASDEPDLVARVNVNENFVWTPDTFDRSAAESPDVLGITPRLIDSATSTLFNHETGNDADGSIMPFSITTNLRNGGKSSFYISSIVPDSIQTGDIALEIDAFEYPQSSQPTNSRVYNITPTTGIVPVDVGGRYWRHTISGAMIGQQWIGGKWQEYLQQGPMQ